MNTENKSTKELILENAVMLFSQNGYDGTSIRDIARLVGIKESSLYNHYKGKKAILDAILDYYISTYKSSLPTQNEMNEFSSQFTDPVQLWVSGILNFIEKLPHLWHSISQILLNEMFLDEKCRKFVLETMFEIQKDTTEMLLQDLVNKEMLKISDIRTTAEQYVYMMYGFDIENRLLLREGNKPEDLKQALIKQISFFIKSLQ